MDPPQSPRRAVKGTVTSSPGNAEKGPFQREPYRLVGRRTGCNDARVVEAEPTLKLASSHDPLDGP
ncbi:hypothetical protein KY285_024027 [Solanum tuberosum]|nr:hypothetical protein KY289_024384 [Solanum tuberosum]KAH0676226.1 hypothetical protein KY285_024027 [Solanum tuberosum]